jgi:hypothetical protein
MDTCVRCGKLDYRDEIMYGCCEKSVDAICCEMCSCSKHDKTKCGKCKELFCHRYHASPGLSDSPETKCCGLSLCSECGDIDINEYEYEGEQEGGHERKLLKCGHEGCNYHEGCRMCVW